MPVDDAVGQTVPNRLDSIFLAGNQFVEHVKTLTDIQAWVEKISGQPEGEWLHAPTIKADLENAKRALKFNRPYAVCPFCQGQRDDCHGCRGHGFVNRAIYDAAPSGMRL